MKSKEPVKNINANKKESENKKEVDNKKGDKTSSEKDHKFGSSKEKSRKGA